MEVVGTTEEDEVKARVPSQLGEKLQVGGNSGVCRGVLSLDADAHGTGLEASVGDGDDGRRDNVRGEDNKVNRNAVGKVLGDFRSESIHEDPAGTSMKARKRVAHELETRDHLLGVRGRRGRRPENVEVGLNKE